MWLPATVNVPSERHKFRSMAVWFGLAVQTVRELAVRREGCRATNKQGTALVYVNWSKVPRWNKTEPLKSSEWIRRSYGQPPNLAHMPPHHSGGGWNLLNYLEGWCDYACPLFSLFLIYNRWRNFFFTLLFSIVRVIESLTCRHAVLITSVNFFLLAKSVGIYLFFSCWLLVIRFLDMEMRFFFVVMNLAVVHLH